jgi:hypothetical protein
MYFETQLFSLNVSSAKKWVLDLDFRWQEMCFSDKNRVKLGTVLIETVLSGDYLYYKIIRKNDKEGRV